MNPKFFFAYVSFICLIGIRANAQVYDRRILHMGETLSGDAYFLFPSFAESSVHFKNGGDLSAKMNYNLLLCQIEFINPKGDTLDLAKTEEIDSVRINGSVFFYKDGCFEIAPGGDSVRLVVLRNASFEPMKIGAMGIASHSGGIESFTSIIAENGVKELVINEDFSITKKTTYFFMLPNGDMQIASKSFLLKTFPSKKKDIEHYIKSNKVNFNRQPDLVKLLKFCGFGAS